MAILKIDLANQNKQGINKSSSDQTYHIEFKVGQYSYIQGGKFSNFEYIFIA